MFDLINAQQKLLQKKKSDNRGKLKTAQKIVNKYKKFRHGKKASKKFSL